VFRLDRIENRNLEYCMLQPTAFEMTVSLQHWCVSESKVVVPQHSVFWRRSETCPEQQISIEL